MAFQLTFPRQEEKHIVETSLMERTVRRTLAVHRGGAIVVWTGPSRNGKTETGAWMVRKIDEAYDGSVDAFRAVHFEVGQIVERSGNEQKQGIKTLYNATIARLPDALYREPPDHIARALVRGLRAKNTQMVIVDEAGLLSLDAIRGMILVRDTAELEGWPLTLVLIGMDDLPAKIERNEQVHNRVHEWCFFQPYSLEETYEILASLHGHFAAMRLDVASERAQVEFVHSQYGGLPGLMVPFLRRLSYVESEMNREIDLPFLRAVHLRTQRDRQRAMDDAARREPTRPGGTPKDVPAGTPKGTGRNAKGGAKPRDL